MARPPLGRRLLSRAAVSEITEKLRAEYEDFCKRDLSEHAIAYLFVDGIAERLRPGQRREAVLAAWGIGEDGRKSLLGLMAGSREDVETVRAFFQDLRARGLGDPLLVVSDGRPASSVRLRRASPARPASAAWRIECAISPLRSRPIRGRNSRRGHSRYQAPSRAIARQLAAGIRADYANALPSALACFEDDFEACIAHLRLPVTHRRFARTTNLLNGCSSRNGEGSRSCPTASARSRCSSSCSARWRGLRSTEFELRQIAPSERNSTTNIRFQPRHWQPQPSPEFPANPSLDRLLARSRRGCRASSLEFVPRETVGVREQFVRRL